MTRGEARKAIVEAAYAMGAQDARRGYNMGAVHTAMYVARKACVKAGGIAPRDGLLREWSFEITDAYRDGNQSVRTQGA